MATHKKITTAPTVINNFDRRDAVRRICQMLDGLCLGPVRSDKIWTAEIKSSLAEIASKNYSLMTCPSEFEQGGRQIYWGEWLYDVCWAEAIPDKIESWKLSRICLVAESEWSKTFSHIAADFDKLMIARADLRLMIYQATTSPKLSVSEIADLLGERVSKFAASDENDLYLLAGHDKGAGRFRFSFIGDE